MAPPRDPIDDTDLTEVQTFEVPEEELDDTNYVPPPPKGQPVDQRQDGGVVGEDALRNQIAALQKKARESEQRAAEAVQQLNDTRRQANEEVTRSRQEAVSSRRSQVDTARAAIEGAIAEADGALVEAKSMLARAYEAGDGNAIADAQVRITEIIGARNENIRRRDALPSVDQLKADEEAITKPKDPAKMTQAEKFEAYVGQFHPASQEWLRKHPECVTNPRLNRRILRLHQEATEDHGMEAESPEYFDFIDERMGYASGENEQVFIDDVPEEQTPLRGNPMRRRQQERTMALRDMPAQRGSDRGARQYTDQRNTRSLVRSAPARGGGSVPSVNGRRQVALTQGEIEHATDGTIVWGQHNAPRPELIGEPIGEVEMARRKMLMSRAGRYMQHGE